MKKKRKLVRYSVCLCGWVGVCFRVAKSSIVVLNRVRGIFHNEKPYKRDYYMDNSDDGKVVYC